MIAPRFPWKQSSCYEGYLIKLLAALDAQPKKRLLKGTCYTHSNPFPPIPLKIRKTNYCYVYIEP